MKKFLFLVTSHLEWRVGLSDHPCQVWFNLVQGFQRRRFKCESLRRTTDAKWWQKLTWVLTRWAKKDKKRSTKHTHKTKDQITRTPLKTGGEHWSANYNILRKLLKQYMTLTDHSYICRSTFIIIEVNSNLICNVCTKNQDNISTCVENCIFFFIQGA